MHARHLLHALSMALLLLPLPSLAESIEDVGSRDVSIRLLVGIPNSPVAVVVLFAGGHGALNIRDDGQFGWGRGNFLVRSRKLFQEQGITTVVIDAPSDKISTGLYHFRNSADHARDVAAVIRHLRARFSLPVWLVGTSRGTESVANAAIRLKTDLPDGIVLTSSMLAYNKNGTQLLFMELETITVPTLIVHHKSDECSVTPYDGVESLRSKLISSRKIDVLEYQGGTPKGGVCDAFHYHGYHGIEANVIKDISDWIKAYSP